ncbi:MAG: hypothetical protein MJZ34_14370 [Paludibacteraceae bacterium]|nr:hypothetical protein [Paludibacteraceae bacterium]
MKIEIGESLFYSWLRHVKFCQLVQTNWKISQQWELMDMKRIDEMMSKVDVFFYQKHKYRIFKNNLSLIQLLNQGECDVLGIKFNQCTENEIYAVDVAFHEGGLNYGDKETTIMKIIEKCVRTAFCIYGYINSSTAEIIFGSPKINRNILSDLNVCFDELNDIFKREGFNYKFSLVANESFNEEVLQPILQVSHEIADTSELFLRSYQLFSMFGTERKRTTNQQSISTVKKIESEVNDLNIASNRYSELKIGKIATIYLRNVLESGNITDLELAKLQTFEYSKDKFDIQYPLLVKEGINYEKDRYYKLPLFIKGQKYYMCSQWYEGEANNDRPYLIKWLNMHNSK